MLLTKENIDSFDFNQSAVILIDKPLSVTSFFVVEKIKYLLRKHLKIKIKIGHAGTLDPLASGLLILCTGSMTKSISKFQEMEKTYFATITLGGSTPSYDLETPIIQQMDVTGISAEQILKVRDQFMGYQELIPPIHSAVKVNGKRSYKLARKGETPVLQAKPIYISRFDITDQLLPNIRCRISCTKGTYIRSIAHEFGLRLHNCAHLSYLRRESIGDYRVDLAFTLDEITEKLKSEKYVT